MKKYIIINGPNLNLLGKREPEIYGNQSFEELLTSLKARNPQINIEYYQSNIEGELVNKIQEVGFEYNGIIINAGAYTHTSVAIRDAISAISTPTIEVHISNIDAREEFRRTSFIGPVCIGSISGFGLHSYSLAISAFLKQ
ncbi:MAG: type II 3-dehydroquinate dehydratase [Bacteroidetes bacterium]|nr:MAG: type II 3-dehydroquinate dehydratase [Bacteroidota bacterium]